MASRLNTIIIVPHSRARFVKLSFSTRTLVIAASTLAATLVLSLVAVVYTGNSVHRRAELKRLKSENHELKQVNHRLETTVSEVQSRLDDFEQRTARLALAAGMEQQPAAPADAAGSGDRVGSGGPYDRLPETPEALMHQGEWIATELDRVESQLERRSQVLGCMPSIAPAVGIVTDGFGRRRDPFTGRWASHTGLDIAARAGTAVASPADGVVVFAGRDGGLGKVVRVSHGFGYTTVFGHLSRIEVEAGDEVVRGETIGRVGSTGRSTGPHLHYEVHQDGTAVNPLYYILDAF